MAMVSADGGSQSFGGLTAQIGWYGLRVGGQAALSLHSSNEPGELTQWLCHDDSTINIVSNIIIIILLLYPSMGSAATRDKHSAYTLMRASYPLPLLACSLQSLDRVSGMTCHRPACITRHTLTVSKHTKDNTVSFSLQDIIWCFPDCLGC